MDLFAPRHLLIILVVVLLVFGTKKLSSIGSDLGGAVRGFKKAMSEGEAEEKSAKSAAPAPETTTPVPTLSASKAEGKVTGTVQESSPTPPARSG